MKVIDFDGTVLDATFSVHPPENGLFSVVFESSGGRAGGPNPRNLQYRQGLTVLLRRLQLMAAVINEIRVETEQTRSLRPDEQQVSIEGRPFPISLAAIGDVDDMRKEISRYARKVGQSPERAVRSGGSSRRLRIFLSNVPSDRALLERQLGGEGADADSDALEAVVEMAAGRSRRGGQGFLVSQAVRKAVETYAVEWATRHYRSQGWVVEDVGATESYDLRCTRESEELHVEVKGTTTAGEQIILTRNEVTHAEDRHPHVELFMVAEVVVETDQSPHPVPSGGVARVWREWRLEHSRLTPVGYLYATGIKDMDGSVSWSAVRMETPARAAPSS